MFKEYKHMEDMEVLSGVNPYALTVEHKQKALRAVNLIKLKMSGKLKIRMCDKGGTSLQVCTEGGSEVTKNNSGITLGHHGN